MAKQSMKQILQGNSYPGRGIVLGCDETGDVLCAYFIMGRSQNSRNRVFVMTDPDTLETRAYDPSQMKDPSLIIYAPVRRMDGKRWIITNGNQTDTIRDALLLGGTFESALRSRTFEPDAPNWTPRISAMVSELNGSPFFRFHERRYRPAPAARRFGQHQSDHARTALRRRDCRFLPHPPPRGGKAGQRLDADESRRKSPAGASYRRSRA